MDRPDPPTMIRRVVFVLVAFAALVQGGCLWLATGAAGGAAVGYAYHKGKMCDTFPAQFGDVWAATHTALAELGMPVLSQQTDADGGVIESRTLTGERVRISLDLRPSSIPADGARTRVCVRVATFGDQTVSEYVLRQVAMHLPPLSANGPPAPPRPPTLGPIQPVPQPASPITPAAFPAETPPPPLATPEKKPG